MRRSRSTAQYRSRRTRRSLSAGSATSTRPERGPCAQCDSLQLLEGAHQLAEGADLFFGGLLLGGEGDVDHLLLALLARHRLVPVVHVLGVEALEPDGVGVHGVG